MTDMATMPIRDLIAEIRAKVDKLFEQNNLVDGLVLNILANRLEDQADTIDKLKGEAHEH